jgi:formate hydrogenlyase subunit 4
MVAIYLFGVLTGLSLSFLIITITAKINGRGKANVDRRKGPSVRKD